MGTTLGRARAWVAGLGEANADGIAVRCGRDGDDAVGGHIGNDQGPGAEAAKRTCNCGGFHHNIPISSFAFLITNAGAMLWHVEADAARGEEQLLTLTTQEAGSSEEGGGGGKGGGGGGGAAYNIRCDDAYESHIDFRWDAHVTRQV